jgi:hypothetical protein
MASFCQVVKTGLAGQGHARPTMSMSPSGLWLLASWAPPRLASFSQITETPVAAPHDAPPTKPVRCHQPPAACQLSKTPRRHNRSATHRAPSPSGLWLLAPGFCPAVPRFSQSCYREDTT